MPFFLVGPTAVGKTALAIELAEQFDAEIVNADAFQVYRGLDVLTAKPDAEAQRRVRHHLLSQISLFETMSAASFRELARAALSDVHSRKKNAIVVGGSGLYLKAITHGFDQVPPPDPKLREELNRLPQKELAERLQKLSPELAARTDLKNPRRVIRAIEIAASVIPSRVVATDAVREPQSAPAATATNGVLLLRHRDDLYQRINERVNAMFRDGVEEEVRALQDIGQTAASALGLKEIRALIAGQISREECIAKIQQATRRYAKRQLTWFRHQTTFSQLNLTPFSHREAVRAITQMFRRAQE
ncbi:MAG: tRNA (adenosine(37)-N6)-dimethylallyltransferase MiaA [Verrucomicrobia bacterium]|nr:MAG: tRNA (adenosine(37)-N6)-dimethylallyltransferase MiaA [Verrucomicrobiota bacterium]PYL89815.1 MAG: tRNA (adenosine(37)-N6)-dimethylallyltransferase MiaA [Verrucomicrobiota bacterium]